MLKRITSLIILLSSYSYWCSAQHDMSGLERRAILDYKKLVNYSRLNESDSINFISQRISQLNQQTYLSIPRNFQIPPELMSYREEGKTAYFIKYNAGKTTSIAYIPSDLVIYYESEAWSDFQINGKNSPLLSIVLAQQFTESAFNPYQKGDGGKSVGLPQLHKPTAKWLWKVDRKMWQRYIYWDKNGLHHFRDIRTQIRFPYDFLPKYKQYSAEKRFEGLRRYNGAGKHAENYAKLVLKRSIVYLELMQQYNYYQYDTCNLLEKISFVINMGLVIKGEHELSKKQISEIANEVKSEFSKNWNYINNKGLATINSIEGKETKLDLSENYKVPSNGKSYFIVIEDGQSLFSYFHNTQEMLNTINHSTNSEYFCYYWKKGKQVKIYTKADMGGRTYFSNALAGSVINIPAGTKIYSPDANIITEICD